VKASVFEVLISPDKLTQTVRVLALPGGLDPLSIGAGISDGWLGRALERNSAARFGRRKLTPGFRRCRAAWDPFRPAGGELENDKFSRRRRRIRLRGAGCSKVLNL